MRSWRASCPGSVDQAERRFSGFQRLVARVPRQVDSTGFSHQTLKNNCADYFQSNVSHNMTICWILRLCTEYDKHQFGGMPCLLQSFHFLLQGSSLPFIGCGLTISSCTGVSYIQLYFKLIKGPANSNQTSWSSPSFPWHISFKPLSSSEAFGGSGEGGEKGT